VPAADPLLTGQVLTVFAITIAAAEVGVALAVILLLYRVRRTSDLDAVRELGAASPTYSEDPGAGPDADPLTGRTEPPDLAGGVDTGNGAGSAGGARVEPGTTAAVATGGDR
jgi:NADH-quinone oxidoreductase subunit K